MISLKQEDSVGSWGRRANWFLSKALSLHHKVTPTDNSMRSKEIKQMWNFPGEQKTSSLRAGCGGEGL